MRACWAGAGAGAQLELVEEGRDIDHGLAGGRFATETEDGAPFAMAERVRAAATAATDGDLDGEMDGEMEGETEGDADADGDRDGELDGD